jgi:DNA-binding NarL/FixJ family response regulator
MADATYDEALDRAHSAIGSAARRMGRRPTELTQGRTDAPAALTALDRLRHGAAPGSGLTDADRLELASAQAGLATRLARRRAHDMELMAATLAACQAAPSVTALADEAPVLAIRLGFERALFSWVRDGRWVPRSARIGDDPTSGAPYVAVADGPDVHVRSFVEERAVRANTAILVSDADTNPGVHRRLQRINRAAAYIAAPVVAHHTVQGLLHVATSTTSGVVDEHDVPLVAAYARGLGTALELAALREHVAGRQPCAPDHALEALSAREREVLALLAEGLTNRQIGERLFVTPETVKTHVRKLMHKLGAATRTQAASYHRAPDVAPDVSLTIEPEVPRAAADAPQGRVADLPDAGS